MKPLIYFWYLYACYVANILQMNSPRLKKKITCTYFSGKWTSLYRQRDTIRLKYIYMKKKPKKKTENAHTKKKIVKRNFDRKRARFRHLAHFYPPCQVKIITSARDQICLQYVARMAPSLHLGWRDPACCGWGRVLLAACISMPGCVAPGCRCSGNALSQINNPTKKGILPCD